MRSAQRSDLCVLPWAPDLAPVSGRCNSVITCVFTCFFYPQTSRLKLLVKPCPGLGFRCRCFARATPLPRRRPPTDKPPLCSLAPCILAACSPADGCSFRGRGFCFREAYYHMYPISTDDLIYAKGHYQWTVDGRGNDWNSDRIGAVVRSPTPPSPPPLPPTGRGVGMGGWASGPQLRFDRSSSHSLRATGRLG